MEEEEEDERRSDDCIKVTFDHIPKTTYGLKAGRSDVAELHLISFAGVSSFHFVLTFDSDYRLVIRGLGSTGGTIVTYDRLRYARKSYFDWIISSSDFLDEVSCIVIEVTKSVQFRLVVPHHDT